jgi:glutamine synthetase
MPGSYFSLAGPNFVLNTIVAEALSEVADGLEKARDVNKAAQALLQKYAKAHKRIIFNGDNYTPE